MPKVQKTNLVKGKTAYGCANYNKGCKVLIPFEFLGKKLTPGQLSDLVTKGKTTKIKGFTNPKTGAKGDGRLLLNNEFKVEFER